MGDAQPLLESSFESDSCPDEAETASTISEVSIWTDIDSECEEETEFHEFIEIDPSRENPAAPSFPFTGTSAIFVPTAAEDEEGDIVGIFEHFFNDSIVSLIVNETNRYAKAHLESARLRKFSRARQWKDTNLSETYIFLAILVLQTIVNKPLVQWYWTKKPSIETPFFSKIMSYKRFCLLKKFIHFVDNDNFDSNTHPSSKLFKIWPIFEHLNNLFMSSLSPDRNLSVDESLLLFNGRLSWMKYIPLKRSKFGIKSYLLCEANSGYIWSIIIYTGKRTVLNEDYKDKSLPTQVVLTLMKPLLNKGHCVIADHFYTSPELAEILINMKTDIYGTVKETRKGAPGVLQKKKLGVGEIIGFKKGKICIFKWRDKKDVTMLSTIHNVDMVEVEKRGETIKKPKAVIDYNCNMSGVDKADQYFQNNEIIKKRGKRFYFKIFTHLLDQTVWNSYVLYKKKGRKKTHLQFRLALIDLLITKYKKEEANPGPGCARQYHSPLRLVEKHFIEQIPPNENKTKPYRQCVVCGSKKDGNGKRIRRETRLYCKDCDVGLCIPCFKIYHTQLNF